MSAVTLAGDSGTRKLPERSQADPAGALTALTGARGAALGPAVTGMVIEDLADRLGVSEAKLRGSLPGIARRQLDRLVAAGTITSAERDVVNRCIADRGGAKCDRAQARMAAIKVRRSLKLDGTELARLKSQLAEDAGAELGKPASDVTAAVRAELKDKLGLGVTMGIVTDRVRDLALSCFDAPADCNVGQVRRAAHRLLGAGWWR